jgi:hypothetical protein
MSGIRTHNLIDCISDEKTLLKVLWISYNVN